MRVSQISVPECYKSSADFRFFLKLFDLALAKTNYDINNILDLYDPLRCPENLLWMLADTMGYKFDDRLPSSFCRLVLTYFASMIRLKGSRDGVILAAEINLDQFNLLDYGSENEILYNRLEDTTIPVNSVSLTEHIDEGYFDLVYFSDTLPIDACIEYVRPLGMYCFQHAGVSYSARTRISIDARLTNYADRNITTGTTRVGHYSREDYARLQKMSSEGGNYSTVDTSRFEKSGGLLVKYKYDPSTGSYVPYGPGDTSTMYFKDELGIMYDCDMKFSIDNAGMNYKIGDILKLTSTPYTSELSGTVIKLGQNISYDNVDYITKSTFTSTGDWNTDKDMFREIPNPYALVSKVGDDGSVLELTNTSVSTPKQQYRLIINHGGTGYVVGDIVKATNNVYVEVTSITSKTYKDPETGATRVIEGIISTVTISDATEEHCSGTDASITALLGIGAVISASTVRYYSTRARSSSPDPIYGMHINEQHKRQLAWKSNSVYENANEGGPSVWAGYRTLYSLQLCNNEHIVKSLVPPIFDIGYGPQDIDVVYPDNYVETARTANMPGTENNDFTKPYNLRYNKYVEDTTAHDVDTLDENRESTIVNPAPKVANIMSKIGDSVISNVNSDTTKKFEQDLNNSPTEFTDSKGNKFYRDAYGRMYLKKD